MHVGLVVSGSLEASASGFRYDRQLVNHFRDRGDTVEVISLPPRGYSRRLADGFSPSIRRQLDRSTDVLLQDELCHPTLWRHNRRLRGPRRIVTLVRRLRTHAPVPCWQRLLASRIERRYLCSVDGIVCDSASTRDAIRALAGTGPPTTVAPPGPDRLPVDGSEKHIVDRSRQRPFRVLAVESGARPTGLDTLIEALANVGIDWTLTVVRGRPDGDRSVLSRSGRTIRDRARAHALDDRLTVLDRVDDETLTVQLDRSHLLAIPAGQEPFGVSYLEAMAAGVVPLVTAAGHGLEVVTHDETGIVVRPDDPDAIALAIAALDADRDRLLELALAARRHSDTYPSWTESMDRIHAFCRRLLGGENEFDRS